MKMNACVKVIVITLIILGSGCTRTVYKPVPLDRPERPALPAVEAQALQCLSDDTFSRILEREQLRREYAEELEVIIDSTQPE